MRTATGALWSSYGNVTTVACVYARDVVWTIETSISIGTLKVSKKPRRNKRRYYDVSKRACAGEQRWQLGGGVSLSERRLRT